MHKKILLSGFLLLAACAETVSVENKWDPNEAVYATRSGSAVISGQGFLRQRGGGVVTCAGSAVIMLPVTAFTVELVQKTTGSPQGGVQGAFSPRLPELQNIDMSRHGRISQCDANGDFQFSNIPAGEWYVTTDVRWTVGDNIIPEGGSIVRRIKVGSGERKRVILSSM